MRSWHIPVNSHQEAISLDNADLITVNDYARMLLNTGKTIQGKKTVILKM